MARTPAACRPARSIRRTVSSAGGSTAVRQPAPAVRPPRAARTAYAPGLIAAGILRRYSVHRARVRARGDARIRTRRREPEEASPLAPQGGQIVACVRFADRLDAHDAAGVVISRAGVA